MIHLSSRTLLHLQHSIREIYSELDVQALRDRILRTTCRVIPSGVVSFATITHDQQQIRYAGRASLRTWEGLDGFVRHMHEHPILNYLHPGQLPPHRFRRDIGKAVRKRLPSLRQAQHLRAAKVSDALTNRQFRSLGIYNEFFRKNEVDYQMLISFLPDQNGYSMVSLNRDRKDFSEEDRLTLNLLGPHIAQSLKNAEAYDKARRTLGNLGGPRMSLKAYGLTYREEDVLYWVAQGKTNEDVAAILRIAPGTVKVHLENIYRKLGVENRTAASALAKNLPASTRKR